MAGSRLVAAVLAASLWTGAAGLPTAAAGREEILVSAAISFGNALDEIVRRYRVLHPDREVVLNTASSGVLLGQIERGAPVDLFVSASPFEIDRLDGQGLLRGGSRTAVASGELVLVVPAGEHPPRRFEDLRETRFGRIAIGNPRTVPAGRYARQALRTLDLWEALQPRLILAENARQVLEYVARGEVSSGLIYRTDALSMAERVRSGPSAPEGSHDAIVYEAAVPAEAPHPDLATELLDFLVSREGRESLERAGFGPPPER